MKTKVVNIVGGPGAGKSTITAGVYYELKKKKLNVEISSEYAKDLVYENRMETFKDELYIFSKQAHRLFRLKNKVDYIITDRPLIMSVVYNNYYNPESNDWNKAFSELVFETWKRYDNKVYLIKRVNDYIQEGRNESEEQAIELDELFKRKLEEYGIEYQIVNGDESAVEFIVEDILKGN